MATSIKDTISQGVLPVPAFKPVIVADHLRDGYWVEAIDINGDGKIDLVASGLAEGHVVWYENPIDHNRPDSYKAAWKMHPIRTFSKPVALASADLNGDGKRDLVACHDYGSCMFQCQPGDGKISWLKNPGLFQEVELENWALRHVDDLLATHRLLFGHFTQKQTLELLALPVVGPKGVHEPVLLTLYKVPAPGEIEHTAKWTGTVIDQTSYRVIHGVMSVKLEADGLDTVLLACEEGIVHLRYADQKWQHAILGQGAERNPNVVEKERQFKGSGNVAAGRMSNDPLAYIAALEPFHGSTVAVYTKNENDSLPWKRTVLDIFGDQNRETGEGNGHHVVAADFDGDGNDEFLVALRGPQPWQGVFYYKAIDLKNGVFTKTQVSSASAARITVADFDGDGRLDFATTGYYTPGYFLADKPQTLVFLNDFAKKLNQ